ncbi:ATP-dependent DNA helicase RecG [Nocardioides mangrovicus]|uniref:ATP-dependent DNA helicase RecG n=1 Tax=Nocardioides mangrovicus TaxID=2478913 RepID=A0A3L8P6V0_9ACTN|nr:ATP-dependent DNA helicase RecG [Nocardioides mangrovicus]RLV51160.1 ATP-dependent DNA helicase RecG [Nocardioides mangrovicus]
MAVSWDSPIAAVAGKEAKKVEQDLGVATVGDLLQHYPRSYVAKGSLSELDDLEQGDHLSVVGEVSNAQTRTFVDRRSGHTRYRTLVTVKGTGGRLALTFFDANKRTADWRISEHRIGSYGLYSGRLKWFNDAWELINPQSKVFSAEGTASEALDALPDLIPIYRAAGKVETWHIQDAVALALTLVDDVPDVLPAEVARAADVLDAATALRLIHQPDTWQQVKAAQKRLKLDEALVTQTVLAQRRDVLSSTTTTARAGRDDGLLDRFDERLPFELTDGQRSVTDDLLADLARERPMHRLLQGEVGSGKTVVALRAMLRVVDSGGQAVLLAPTEVLAQQHERSVRAMLGPLAEAGQIGGDADGTRVALLTGSLTAAQRKQALLDVASGEAGLVIGTHALLQDTVQYVDLGLVVVDEQHRFGVEQRAALTARSDTPPHVLVMTATPIPRTVAMTVFGDLETSVLRDLPRGRGEVQSTVVPAGQEAWMERVWSRIREEVAAGRQAYVVCPRIDATDDEEDSGLAAVEEQVVELADGPLAGLGVAKLHGRMAPDDKDATMRAFAAGEVDVLVSTTVIEVGVDVPNATVMVILDADRFGVSQLHQLRGRIGRGGHAGLCLLVTGVKAESPSLERLQAVAGTRDGFELAEVDLRQRREGDVLGTRQSGKRQTLRLLSVLDDADVIETARGIATDLVAADPTLAHHRDLAAAVRSLAESEAADYLDKG